MTWTAQSSRSRTAPSPLAEGRTQSFGSIFGPFPPPGYSARGVGLEIPVRDPAHADPQWFECDLDDQIDDPDAPFIELLPTERHRSVPGFS